MSSEFKAYPYQDLLIKHFLTHPRAAGWAGMGLGKTVSALTSLEVTRYTDNPYPALVIGPQRVARSVWTDEAAKWAHLKHLKTRCLVGPLAERKAALKPGADIYAINYDVLPWLVKTLKGQWPFRTIIADEARKLKGFRGGFRVHQKSGKVYYQGAGGARARALGQVAHLPQVERFIELTGTPSPKGLDDLWGQLWFLDRGKRLGNSFDAFSRRWFRKGFDGYSLEASDLAQEEIQDRVKDLCLSIDAADWFDLEQPIYKKVEVPMPPRARGLYDKMQAEFFMELKAGVVEAANAAVKSMKLLQLANGAVYTAAPEWEEIHDAKIEALESIIEEASGPVLVAYHFDSDRERILRAIPGARHLRTKRDEDDFKAGRIPVLLAHPASAGHGIDGFQNACNVIAFFGHWWDLELRDQIIGRIGPVRQMQAGLKRPVWVYDIVAEGTVDNVVLRRHETKRSVQDLLLEAARGVTSTSGR